jgi:hypothetical protein
VGVGKRAHQLSHGQVARCPGTRTLDQPTDAHNWRASSIGAQCGVVSGEASVRRSTVRRISSRACLPHRDHEVSVAIAAQELVSLAGCLLVIQDVPGHRAVRSDDRLPRNAAGSCSWLERCRLPGDRPRSRETGQPATFCRAEPGESGSVAEHSAVAIGARDVGVVRQVACAGPAGARCPVSKAAAS